MKDDEMTSDEYLGRVLEDQKLTQPEIDELRQHRADVQGILEEHFSESHPTIQYAGSYKKETMIRDSYDLDVACFFARDDDDAGANLHEIYDSAYNALSEHYDVEKKTSALRVKEKAASVSRTDFRIDIVPGRFTDDSESDVFLHQQGSDKLRLKTNLQTHVDHIRNSGVRDAIKLLKLWKYQRRVCLKTFILELLVVQLLEDRKNESLSDQLICVLTRFRDSANDLSVTDPANSNNDLTSALDAVRSDLAAWAAITLGYVENSDWESVFGKLPEVKKSEAVITAAIARVAVSSPPVRPWLPKE